MSVALGLRLLPNVRSETTVNCCGLRLLRRSSYQLWILISTFLTYASYHMTRKPLSVVKNTLHRNCTDLVNPNHNETNSTTWCDWAPFDGDDSALLFGWLDTGFLIPYAASMFLSGYIAERVNLRYFLTLGMLCSGLSCVMFGLGYFLSIHQYYYFLIAQILAGAFQSTGWPAVVAVVGNWFGPGRRGAIMGLWNAHTSVGNILGGVIPAIWADDAWGWSFVVPGLIMCGLAIINFLFLAPYPKDVGIEIENSRAQLEKHHSANHTSSTPNHDAREDQPLLHDDRTEHHKAIPLLKALRLPGVLEFAFCLFFAKLVSYTFLFWLPKYIGATMPELAGSSEKSADLSTFFDVGGVVGGFFAGMVTDYNKSPAINCVVMLLLGTPMLFIYEHFGSESYAVSVVLLLLCGTLVNGPYALITTAVSAELGTQRALKGNKKALATVSSIIDGTGSIGAAIGPMLTGLISPYGWQNVFYMLIASNFMAVILLIRIVVKEVRISCFGYVPPEERHITDAEIIVDAD